MGSDLLVTSRRKIQIPLEPRTLIRVEAPRAGGKARMRGPPRHPHTHLSREHCGERAHGARRCSKFSSVGILTFYFRVCFTCLICLN